MNHDYRLKLKRKIIEKTPCISNRRRTHLRDFDSHHDARGARALWTPASRSLRATAWIGVSSVQREPLEPVASYADVAVWWIKGL